MLSFRQVAILLVVSMAPLSAHAQETDGQKPGVITVSGEGFAHVAPDMAVVSLTVVRIEKTAREALDANNEAMAALLDAMKAEGIADRDLQTSSFSINPQYVYPKRNDDTQEAPRIDGYSVSNTLTVRIRDLSKLGAILDQSVSLGVNQGGQILFTNDDPSSAVAEARKMAVSDAIARAKTLVEAAGVTLGRITSISEQNQGGRPVPMMRAEMADASFKSAVPVASGENEFSVSVTMAFEIAQ